MKGRDRVGPPPAIANRKHLGAARTAHGAQGPPPRSCDTFVVVVPLDTAGTAVVFGKNSDRPTREVQELLTVPPGVHPPKELLQCTYITIPQVPRTHGVILSKPSWMWGAEMGANDAGVVVGNEAVWTKEPEDGPPALLGMDLVRLALERSSTAEAAVQILVSLLETHGQGGSCEEGGSWSYHNSFLLADASEAWVVETAGTWWAAERVTAGPRNISNCLSIRTRMDRCSTGLSQYAQQQGYWDGRGDFDWAAAFATGRVPTQGRKTPGREAAGCLLLDHLVDQAAASTGGGGAGFLAEQMMAVLRDKGSGICMTGTGEDEGFRTNGAQVSVLIPGQEACHWFTGTPDPSRSIFKPFRFSKGFDLGPLVTSTSTGGYGEAWLKGQQQQGASTGQSERNPSQPLWRAWSKAMGSGRVGGERGPAGVSPPPGVEERGLAEEWLKLERSCRSISSGGSDAGPFSAAVQSEIDLYGGQG